MQGLAQRGVALTAYIITAFVQNKANTIKYADVITKALNFVKTTMNTFEDVYALSIACYAAHLANHESKTDLLQRLVKLAKDEGNFFTKSIL